MSIQIDKIANDLFEKIRSRFEDISLGDEKAKSTQKPENARFFNFDYIADGENFGNITISLIDELSLKIYFSKNISENLNEHQRKHWYDFLKELRFFAKRSSLNFEPRDITRNTLKHRDIQQLSKDDDTYSRDELALGESLHKAYTMTKQNKFAKQFERWANQITESAWSDDSYEQHDAEKVEDLISLLSSPLEVGIDAINAINALVGIITSDELSDELLALANEDPSEDARYVILDWLESEQPELYQMVLDDVSEPSEEAPEEELDEVRGERDHDREREENERQQPNWNDDEEDEYDPDEHENEADYRYQQEKDARATGELSEDDYDNRRISEWKIKFNLSDGRTHYEFVEAYTSQEAKLKIKELIKKVSASYKGTDKEVRHISYNCISGPEMGGRSIGEGEVDEGKGLIRKAAAGAALIGALGAGSHAMDQSSYSASPQLQKLEQLHQQAVKSGDSNRADSLSDRIENHKARLGMGKGEVRTASGAPKEVYESLTDIRKLAGLLKG